MHKTFNVPGLDPKFPVGWRAQYRCPEEGMVFKENIYRMPYIFAECLANGEFEEPNWMTCVHRE